MTVKGIGFDETEGKHLGGVFHAGTLSMLDRWAKAATSEDKGVLLEEWPAQDRWKVTITTDVEPGTVKRVEHKEES